MHHISYQERVGSDKSNRQVPKNHQMFESVHVPGSHVTYIPGVHDVECYTVCPQQSSGFHGFGSAYRKEEEEEGVGRERGGKGRRRKDGRERGCS